MTAPIATHIPGSSFLQTSGLKGETATCQCDQSSPSCSCERLGECFVKTPTPMTCRAARESRTCTLDARARACAEPAGSGDGRLAPRRRRRLRRQDDPRLLELRQVPAAQHAVHRGEVVRDVRVAVRAARGRSPAPLLPRRCIVRGVSSQVRRQLAERVSHRADAVDGRGRQGPDQLAEGAHAT